MKVTKVEKPAPMKAYYKRGNFCIPFTKILGVASNGNDACKILVEGEYFLLTTDEEIKEFFDLYVAWLDRKSELEDIEIGKFTGIYN